jgi:CheY-like chemotaxis protein
MPTSHATDLQRPFIVVVDDEKRIADTLALILDSKGYSAEAAHDGESALEICRHRIPDLVLSDVVMPGMSGIELTIAVSQQFRDCHILLFSGQADTAAILEDAKRQGYDFELIAKPLHPEDLVTKIKDLIGPPMPAQGWHDDEPCRDLPASQAMEAIWAMFSFALAVAMPVVMGE